MNMRQKLSTCTNELQKERGWLISHLISRLVNCDDKVSVNKREKQREEKEEEEEETGGVERKINRERD